MAKTLLIDADSIAYKKADKVLLGAKAGTGFVVEEDGDVHLPTAADNTDIYIEKHIDDEGNEYEIECCLQTAKEEVESFINELLEVSKCDKAILFLTMGKRHTKIWDSFPDKQIKGLHNDEVYNKPRSILPNFRYEVSKVLAHGYKHNRVSKPLPGSETLLYVMAKEFDSRLCDFIEADDAIVAHYDEKEHILAAMDKDVLNSVPGYHIDYHKLGTEKEEDELLYFTSIETAEFYKYYQTVIGDPSDGYKGVPGIGKARVGKYITEEMDKDAVWQTIVELFKSKGLTEEDALATVRLASMHQVFYDPGEDVYVLNIHKKDELFGGII
jgi:hypothetical protein